MIEEVTVQFLKDNFPELVEEIASRERERILAVVTTAFRAGVPVTDELVDRALRDPSVSARDVAAGLFEREVEARAAGEARERAQHAAHLQGLRDAESRLAPHVPTPDTGQDDGEDFGALVRRAGDAAAAARGGVR